MVPLIQGSIIPNDAKRGESKRFEYLIKQKEDQSRILSKLMSKDFTFQLNVNIGPNVNVKFPKKLAPTTEEKEFFKKKIKITKKTELCKNWVLYNDCYFKDNCSFAHGESELRAKYTGSNIKYKTKVCKTFVEKMYCPFGSRCQYRHVLTTDLPFTYSYLNNFLAEQISAESSKFEHSKNFEFHKVLDCVNMNFKFEV